VDKVTSDTDLDGVFDTGDFSQTTSQSQTIDAASNKLLGFTQTLTKVKGTKTEAITASQVNYALDANGAMTSDGLRTFEYDASGRLSKVKILKDGEAAKITYLHSALGQRVFKSEPQMEQTLPQEAVLGTDFVTWLKKRFGWLFTQAQANTSIGTAFIYDEDGNLLGEYDNGSAKGKGRQEYIWLPTDDGQAIPIGIYRNRRIFAVHADHLGTPRLITDDSDKPVWQWPYSAFGNNKPTGVLKATPNPKAAMTNQPVLLKATAAGIEVNLRFPGQYFDEESNLSYNYFRSYSASQGRYSQPDPIGLDGGLNRFGYVGGNPLSRTDSRGLATDEEIRRAIATLKCANPGDFPKLPSSVTMASLGEKGAGSTDWSNNIQLNSGLYGDSSTPVNEFVRSNFLQTLAHEMLHVNQGPGSFLLSNQFRMSNPAGYLHRLLDAKAEAMITQQLLDQYNKALAGGDSGCACTR
jgi:RHS repeat-associated protein